ncbi:hypothetical protein DERF_011736 [Dermatophagoides farinae]|uniref:Uncharacterized protein n=1 Tax=Dermatophagoides farinae TaxID=6954 RepID=A0A922HXR7_DERFA|nr:hypothetical protein DERF_011736 [Dermatophagoides farinae]
MGNNVESKLKSFSFNNCFGRFHTTLPILKRDLNADIFYLDTEPDYISQPTYDDDDDDGGGENYMTKKKLQQQRRNLRKKERQISNNSAAAAVEHKYINKPTGRAAYIYFFIMNQNQNQYPFRPFIRAFFCNAFNRFSCSSRRISSKSSRIPSRNERISSFIHCP